MKIAVIGTGKTGKEVLNMLDSEQIIGPFDTENRPTVEKLQPADGAIIFVPGTAVDDILDTVLASGITAVWGSTGYDWDDAKLDETLNEEGLKWLKASNFSLGMQLVRQCLQLIGKSAGVLDDPAFHIHEVHHVHKKDAPSGTALSWQAWLGLETEITSERKGDIKGIHQFELKTPFESVSLKHEALDRAVFAQGALWALQQLSNEALKPGFYTMETLFDHKNRLTNEVK